MWTPPSRKRPQGGDANRGWPRIPREARPQGGKAPGRRGPRKTRPKGGHADRGFPRRQNSLGRETVRLTRMSGLMTIIPFPIKNLCHNSIKRAKTIKIKVEDD